MDMDRSTEAWVAIEEELFVLNMMNRRAPTAANRGDGLIGDVTGRQGTGGPSERGPVLQEDTQPVWTQTRVSAPPCNTWSDMCDQLHRLRHERALEVEREGGLLVPLGSAPSGRTRPASSPGLDGKPDRELDRRLDGESEPVGGHVFNSMSVTVPVPGRDVGVGVLNRLRPWLHVLVGLSANSPIVRGRDTGFASWRTVNAAAWAVAGPPPRFKDATDYDRQVERLTAMGAIQGPSDLNWSVRLSDTHDDQQACVQIKAADTQLEVEDAATLAELCRALVLRAIRDSTLGVVEPNPPHEVVRAACWQAARHGVSGFLADLGPGAAGDPQPAGEVVGSVLAYVELAMNGDLEPLKSRLAELLSGGIAAERQRRAWSESGLAGIVRLAQRCVPTGSVPGDS